MLSGGFRFALPTLRSAMTKERRKRNADRRVQPTSASRDAARTLVSFPSPACGGGLGGGTLAYRRSTTALTVRAFGPWAQLQARLPGTWQDVRSGKLAPTGERRPRALARALPAPACPSPGNAPPGPVVVPVSMMPEAARVRSVSVRARAPHSLRIREYPRPKASFTERDSFSSVPDPRTNVNENATTRPSAIIPHLTDVERLRYGYVPTGRRIKKPPEGGCWA